LSTTHKHAPGTSGAVGEFLAEIEQSNGDIARIELLSDLDREGARRLRDEWPRIPERRRPQLVRQMVEDAESNIEHVYGRAMRVALSDRDPMTRLAALDGLWEFDAPGLLDELLHIAEAEDSDQVRAALAVTLAPHAQRADAGELGAQDTDRLKRALLNMHLHDRSLDVRRRALETMGYLSTELSVGDAIQSAFESGSFQMRISAIRAMGHNADERWLPACYEELGSDEPEVRFEAVAAIGYIGDERSSPRVVDVLTDDDAEIRLAAVVALGAIGGPIAINALRRLIRDEDDTLLIEAAEDALNEAQLVANPLRPPS